MLNKLRWKFVLINMILVTLVLTIVFTAVLASSYHRLEMDGVQAMERVLREGDTAFPKREIGGKLPGGKAPQKMMTAAFYVELDGGGAVQRQIAAEASGDGQGGYRLRGQGGVGEQRLHAGPDGAFGQLDLADILLGEGDLRREGAVLTVLQETGLIQLSQLQKPRQHIGHAAAADAHGRQIPDGVEH